MLSFFPYKEEVTGSNPVAPTRVFQKSLYNAKFELGLSRNSTDVIKRKNYLTKLC